MQVFENFVHALTAPEFADSEPHSFASGFMIYSAIKKTSEVSTWSSVNIEGPK